jgi:hypothetical protein
MPGHEEERGASAAPRTRGRLERQRGPMRGRRQDCGRSAAVCASAQKITAGVRPHGRTRRRSGRQRPENYRRDAATRAEVRETAATACAGAEKSGAPAPRAHAGVRLIAIGGRRSPGQRPPRRRGCVESPPERLRAASAAPPPPRACGQAALCAGQGRAGTRSGRRAASPLSQAAQAGEGSPHTRAGGWSRAHCGCGPRTRAGEAKTNGGQVETAGRRVLAGMGAGGSRARAAARGPAGV